MEIMNDTLTVFISEDDMSKIKKSFQNTVHSQNNLTQQINKLWEIGYLTFTLSSQKSCCYSQYSKLCEKSTHKLYLVKLLVDNIYHF